MRCALKSFNIPDCYSLLLTQDCGYTGLNGDEPIVFGRIKELDYVFNKDTVKMVNWRNISKKHFYIKRNPESSDVRLFDLSSNGTFVNGVKVGKNRFYPLTHLATIGLGLPGLNVFTFINNKDKSYEEERMPVGF